LAKESLRRYSRELSARFESSNLDFSNLSLKEETLLIEQSQQVKEYAAKNLLRNIEEGRLRSLQYSFESIQETQTNQYNALLGIDKIA